MIYLYILVMAVVTYLIRMLPLTAIRGEIKNRFFRRFLYFVPYVTLAVMTFPAILYSTDSIYSALAGFAMALILAYFGRSLITVSLFACGAAFITELIMRIL